ncbi:hypothetical protein JCM13304A_13620 [Desulfothermus okinawensis JCM 13304]
MSKLVLLDTNVLIYAVDADSKFHKGALALFSDPTIRLFTTSKNISEFLVVLTRHSEVSLPSYKCLELLEGLLSSTTVLYPTPITFSLFQNLVKKYNPKGLWIHDLEIASIGLAYGISTIATKNIHDFMRISEIKIMQI